MTITLSPESEAFLDQIAAERELPSREAALESILQSYQRALERDRQHLRKLIQEAEDSGPPIPYDMEETIQFARDRRASRDGS